MYNMLIVKADGSPPGEENTPPEPESKIAESPETPEPGEGAVSHPGTAHGKLRTFGSGDRPTPEAGVGPISAGGRPVTRPGTRARFTPGQGSLRPVTSQGEELAKPEEYGEGPTGGYGKTNYESQHGSQDEQFSGLTLGSVQRSLNAGFAVDVEPSGFAVVSKGDQPVTRRQTVFGVPFRVENPVGSVRQGKDPDGVPWKTVMTDHYGYIPGVPGVDGDSLDVFIGPEARKIQKTKGKEGSFDKVWVVHSKDPQSHRYDEDKVMFGYGTKDAAVTAFRRHYDKPDDFMGPVNEYSLDEFKQILQKLKNRKSPMRIGRGRFPVKQRRR